MEVIQYINGLPESNIKPNDIPILHIHLITKEKFQAWLDRDKGPAPQHGKGRWPWGQSLLPNPAI